MLSRSSRSLILLGSLCLLLCIPANSWAVTGIAGDGNAGAAQYRAPGGDQGGVLGDGNQSPSGCSTTARSAQVNCPEDETGTAPSVDDGTGTAPVANPGDSDDVKAAQQLSTGGDDRLPFTGLSVLALGFVGALLLAGGMIGRRTATVRT